MVDFVSVNVSLTDVAADIQDVRTLATLINEMAEQGVVDIQHDDFFNYALTDLGRTFIRAMAATIKSDRDDD